MKSVPQAKDFLVGKIVEEAQRQGLDLSEAERRLLYFSEASGEGAEGSTVECDPPAHERKIAKLIRAAYRRLSKEQGEELKAWAEAIHVLRKGDHYLLVMVDQAVGTARPPGTG